MFKYIPRKSSYENKYIKYRLKFPCLLAPMRKYLIKELVKDQVFCARLWYLTVLYTWCDKHMIKISPALLFFPKLHITLFNCSMLHQSINTCVLTAEDNGTWYQGRQRSHSNTLIPHPQNQAVSCVTLAGSVWLCWRREKKLSLLLKLVTERLWFGVSFHISLILLFIYGFPTAVLGLC